MERMDRPIFHLNNFHGTSTKLKRQVTRFEYLHENFWISTGYHTKTITLRFTTINYGLDIY